MALGETAKLVAELDLKNNMSGPASQALGSLDRIEKKVGTLRIATGTALGNAFTSIGNLAVKGLGKAFGALEAGIDSLRQVDTLNRQTAAVIQSTGGAAGVTAKQVSDLAAAQEDLTTVDDKVVQGGENMLLTFTNIGKDVFPDATKAMVNLGVAMAGGDADAVDLQATAIQLGKALNDPIKGVTALTKVGVSFTQAQKDQIKAMVEAGDVAGAQKVILDELGKEFGKAGEAAGTGYAADMRRFNDAVEGAEQALAVGFLPVIQEVTQWLNEKLRDPKVITAIKDLGTQGAGLLEKGFKAVQNIPWDQVGQAFKLVGEGAKAAYDLFNGLPDWVKTAVLTGWGLNKLSGGLLQTLGANVAGSLFDVVAKAFAGRGSTPANPLFVSDISGGLGGKLGGAGGAGGLLAGLGGATTIAGMVALVADQIGRLPQLAQGVGEAGNVKSFSDLQKTLEDIVHGSTIGNTLGAPFLKPFEDLIGITKGVQDEQIKTTGELDHVAQSTTRTADGQDELKRINQQAANQLGQMTDGVAGLPTKLGGIFDRIATARTNALAAGFKSGTAAIKQEISSKLGITVKELGTLRGAFRSALASELGITTGELRHLNRTFDFDEEKIAAKLGISVDQLRQLKAEAQTTAANTTKIKNKDWSPTINVPVKVTSTFSVSGRAVATATERFWSINRPRVT
jgi:hypothetical protein